MAESAGLENRYRGNSIGGSNPPLSAIFDLAAGSLRSRLRHVENMLRMMARRNAPAAITLLWLLPEIGSQTPISTAITIKSGPEASGPQTWVTISH